jgi:hypothetical protein
MFVRRRHGVNGAAALLATFLVAAACAADDADFRYKFKEGDKLRYMTEIKTTVESESDGETTPPVETTQTIEVTWDVTKVEKEGRATVTTTLDRARVVIQTAKAKSEYDTKTDKEPDNPILKRMAKPLKDLVGGLVTLTIETDGEVSDINSTVTVPQGMFGQGVVSIR